MNSLLKNTGLTDPSIENLLETVHEQERQKKEDFSKNIPSLIWSALTSIAEVAVVFFLLGNTYGVDVQILSAIVVVYAYVRSIGNGIGLSTQAQALVLANELHQIKTKLEIPQEEGTFEKIKEGNRNYRKLETNTVIQSVGVFLLYAIAIWHLVSSLQG